MINNIIYWGLIENSGKLVLKKEYLDYLNSFIHGSILSIFSIKELLYNNDLDKDMNSEQIAILNLSRGYFIYDLLKMLLIKRYRSNLYMLHHLSLLYFFHFFKKYNLTRIFIQSLFLGETTNPVLQIWSISKKMDYKEIFKYSNHIFSNMFIVFRCILIPLFYYNKLPQLLNNTNISKFDLRMVFTLSFIFNIGNFAWSYQLFRGYLKWCKK